MGNTILATLGVSIAVVASTSTAFDPQGARTNARDGAPARAESLSSTGGRLRVLGAEDPPEAPRTVGTPTAATVAGCTIVTGTADRSSSSACLACHARFGDAGSHPVDVDYRMAQYRSDGSLRPLEAAVARGVFVPEGRVQCTTCHDGRSPWANHVALPPGAVARPAVNPLDPGTYENRPNWRIDSGRGAPPLEPGSAVSPAPLCIACHTHAD